MADKIAHARADTGTRKRASRPPVLPRSKTVRAPRTARPAIEPPRTPRVSAILRGLLADDSGGALTVRKLCAAMGSSSFGASLLVFSIPEVVPLPVPGLSAVVAAPTAVIAGQMIAGYKAVRLPKWLLKRRVPRAALVKAIRAVLPALERAERATRPRGRWVSHPWTQRVLGVFLFLLALVIALPVPGTNVPPALAIFITSLGMVERDGLAIAVGVLIGLASMALIGGVTLGMLKLIKKYFVPALPF